MFNGISLQCFILIIFNRLIVIKFNQYAANALRATKFIKNVIDGPVS